MDASESKLASLENDISPPSLTRVSKLAFVKVEEGGSFSSSHSTSISSSPAKSGQCTSTPVPTYHATCSLTSTSSAEPSPTTTTTSLPSTTTTTSTPISNNTNCGGLVTDVIGIIAQFLTFQDMKNLAMSCSQWEAEVWGTSRKNGSNSISSGGCSNNNSKEVDEEYVMMKGQQLSTRIGAEIVLGGLKKTLSSSIVGSSEGRAAGLGEEEQEEGGMIAAGYPASTSTVAIPTRTITNTSASASTSTSSSSSSNSSNSMLRELHRLTFRDILEASMMEAESDSPPGALLPHPEHLRKCTKLDLSGFVGTSSPRRPLIRSSSNTGGNGSYSSSSLSSTSSSSSSVPSSPLSSPARVHETKSNITSTIIIPTSTTTTTSTSTTSIATSSVSQPQSPIRRQENSNTSDLQQQQGWLNCLLVSQEACSRLRVLVLGNTVPRWMQESLLSKCTNLVSLCLRGCEKVDDTLLHQISSTKLRAIDLNGCWRVTDQGLQYLLRQCPLMEKAMLGGVWKLSDVIVNTFSASWPLLSILEITASHYNISAAALMQFIRESTSELKALRLSTGHFASGEGGWSDILCKACALPSVRSHLNVVDIEGAFGLTDNNFLEFVEACKKFDDTLTESGAGGALDTGVVAGATTTASSAVGAAKSNATPVAPTSLAAASCCTSSSFSSTLKPPMPSFRIRSCLNVSQSSLSLIKGVILGY